MGQQRYTPEFKDEAVRQVTERGHPVQGGIMVLDPNEPDRGTAPRPIYFYAGVFLVCSAVLILQIVQTRILSVSTWYELAFFVISMAMLARRRSNDGLMQRN